MHFPNLGRLTGAFALALLMAGRKRLSQIPGRAVSFGPTRYAAGLLYTLFAKPPFRPGVVTAHESMRVQALPAELAIERFDKRVVGRFPGAREVEDDTLLISP